MEDVAELVEGYHRFLDTRYAEQSDLYRTLAEDGQAPKTAIIACCDSRVDPATIFAAGPGQLFIVRNVANLVPPFEPLGNHHGTSAALEFAVEGLEVENIVVMGHARCGGVRAFLDDLYVEESTNSFIGRWMSLLKSAHTDTVRNLGRDGDISSEEQQQAMEHAAVRSSLENLETFPFIRDRLAAGKLKLRGAYFDIADGRLLTLDQTTGAFRPLK